MLALQCLHPGALLLLGLLLTAPPSTASASEQREQAPLLDNTTNEIKVLGRRLMERVEDHRERLDRIDRLIRFHRAQGNFSQIRELERLRQREIAAFEQTLSEYRRLLGDRDFERVGRAVRFLVERQRQLGRDPVESPSAPRGPEGGSDVASANPRTPPGPTAAERSIERQWMVERARASQRLQLAQRLEQARADQLRLMAEQQRRYQPPAAPAAPQGAAEGRGRGAAAQPAPAQRQGATRRPAPPPQRRP